MRISKIINTGLTHFNTVKYSKIPDETVNSAVTPSIQKSRYSKSNFFNLERGALKESDMALVEKIEEKIPEILNYIASPIKDFNQRLLSWEAYIPAPKNIVALKIDNPKVMAISASVKKAGAESYLDFNVHGYFGEKQRFLINREGEVVKTITPDFFKGEKAHAYDADPVYYTQYEINNLGLNRYLTMFKNKMDDLKNYMLRKDEQVKVIEPQKGFDKDLFLLAHKSKLNKIRREFDVLYDAITTNSRTTNHLKKFSDICSVRPHRKYRIMQLDNINDTDQNAIVNFTELGRKQVARITVYDNSAKTQRVFVDGELVDEYYRDSTNPFLMGKIKKVYTPEEMDKINTLNLLEGIDKRLIYGLNKLRAMIGDKFDRV
jgi:hypothetical protein